MNSRLTLNTATSAQTGAKRVHFSPIRRVNPSLDRLLIPRIPPLPTWRTNVLDRLQMPLTRYRD